MSHAPIGIDLGTTNSLIAVFENGAPRLLANSLGELMTPSVVSQRDGALLVGQAAWDQAATDPSSAAATFKRKMGTESTVTLAGKKLSAPELSALVLKKLKTDAEAALGETITDVVVSVPAYFNQVQRSATQTACRLAGLTPLRLINEPTAAALAYGLQDKDGESEFLVFDLGGGTFDVTVLEHFDGVMEVKASSGDAFLGGEDFTAVIFKLLAEKIEVNPINLGAKGVAALNYYAEQAKRQLSTSERACEFDFELDGKPYSVKLTPEEFETAAATLIKRIRQPIHRCIYDAAGHKRPLDRVILVGGSTRMPLARKIAARETGLFPDSTINPDHAVALGAAVQAGLIAEDKALDDVVMTDVSPFSVGIEIAPTDDGGRSIDGVFSPIIERNTALPASREESYCTVSRNQKKISVRIFQGESARVVDNVALGMFAVSVPAAEAGREWVSIRVTYDVSGLIEIIGTAISTGKSGRLIVETSGKPMDEVDISRKLAELAELKIHPQDAEVNIAVVERMKRLYEMTVGANRDEVQRLLIDFEAVLQKQVPQDVQAERERVVAYLDAIDGFYES